MTRDKGEGGAGSQEQQTSGQDHTTGADEGLTSAAPQADSGQQHADIEAEQTVA